MRKIAGADGYPVFAVEPRLRRHGKPAVYLSAGIHGDEPAATEALVTWAARRARLLQQFDFLILPCLNPWGLRHNNRHDARGRDLNRGYHRSDVPVIRAQKALLRGRKFDAALMLHEDFDGRGVYIYEIPGAHPCWGEELLAAVERHLPRDPRTTIEGRRCRRGLIRPRVIPARLPGHPEALFLAAGHTRRSLTFETPSEFSMTARVRAHCAVLDALVRLAR